jgi:hypothetical protein
MLPKIMVAGRRRVGILLLPGVAMVVVSGRAPRRRNRVVLGAALVIVAAVIYELSVAPAAVVSELEDLSRSTVPPPGCVVVSKAEPFSSGMKAGFAQAVRAAQSCEEMRAYYNTWFSARGFSFDGVHPGSRGQPQYAWTRDNFCALLKCPLAKTSEAEATYIVGVDWQRVRLAACR